MDVSEEKEKVQSINASSYGDTGMYDVGAKELNSEPTDISIEEVDIVDTKKICLYKSNQEMLKTVLIEQRKYLKSIYSKEGVKKRASKVEAMKLNERGVEAVYKQINGNNLVVTELGDLNPDMLGELNKTIRTMPVIQYLYL